MPVPVPNYLGVDLKVDGHSYKKSMHNIAHASQQQQQSNSPQSPQLGTLAASILSTSNPVSSSFISSNANQQVSSSSSMSQSHQTSHKSLGADINSNNNNNLAETLTLTGLDIKSNRHKELSGSAATVKSGIQSLTANTSTNMKLRKETTLPTISVATTIHELANREQQNLLHLTNFHLHSSSTGASSSSALLKNHQNFSSMMLNINNSASGKDSSANLAANIDSKIREAGLSDLSNLTFSSRTKKHYINSDYIDNKEYKALKPHNHNQNAPKVYQFQQPYIAAAANTNNANSGSKLSSDNPTANPNFTITASNTLGNAGGATSSTNQNSSSSKGKLVNLTVKPPLNLSPNFNFLNNEPKNLHRQTAFATYYASLIEQTRSMSNTTTTTYNNNNNNNNNQNNNVENNVVSTVNTNQNSGGGGGAQTPLLKKQRHQLDKKSRQASNKKGLLTINTLQVSDLNDLDSNSILEINSSHGDDLNELSSHKLAASTASRLVNEINDTDNTENNLNINSNKKKINNNGKRTTHLSKKLVKSSPKLLILKLSKNKVKTTTPHPSDENKNSTTTITAITSNTTTTTFTTITTTNNTVETVSNIEKSENFLKQCPTNTIEVKHDEVSKKYKNLHSTTSSTTTPSSYSACSCFTNNFRSEDNSNTIINNNNAKTINKNETLLSRRKASLPVSPLINTHNNNHNSKKIKAPSQLYQKLLPSRTNIITTSIV